MDSARVIADEYRKRNCRKDTIFFLSIDTVLKYVCMDTEIIFAVWIQYYFVISVSIPQFECKCKDTVWSIPYGYRMGKNFETCLCLFVFFLSSFYCNLLSQEATRQWFLEKNPARSGDIMEIAWMDKGDRVLF